MKTLAERLGFFFICAMLIASQSLSQAEGRPDRVPAGGATLKKALSSDEAFFMSVCYRFALIVAGLGAPSLLKIAQNI
ncbi:hypothetical protein ACQKP8_27035 [Photobacterium alginatilyticum]|uniref:hypothetical protein n=1 Tax=Photobacterium alginatilyticum TaxID=1775171 RepID=UPI004068CDF2